MGKPLDWKTVELDDDDAPDLTAEILARAKPAREVLTPAQQASFKRAPGRPLSVTPKKQVTLRLDADLLDHWRSQGAGWQSAINAVLRRASGLTN